MKNKLSKIRKLIKEKGISYTISFVTRYQINELILDKYALLKNKLQNSSNNNNLLDLPSHTIVANREFWDNYYDWSEKGNEWTLDATKYKQLDPEKWKNDLINKMMKKYIKENCTILEIGPGGGRWTEFLEKLSNHLILADIAQKCLDICKERFKTNNHIEYNLIKNRLDFVEKNSIDYIWSYDVFVHMNPTDIQNYIEDIAKILKSEGIAIIHHSGTRSSYEDKKEGWKSFMGKKQFAEIVEKNDMKIIEQNTDLVHFPRDIISVFKKS